MTLIRISIAVIAIAICTANDSAAQTSKRFDVGGKNQIDRQEVPVIDPIRPPPELPGPIEIPSKDKLFEPRILLENRPDMKERRPVDG
jgi:hypothetical protein